MICEICRNQTFPNWGDAYHVLCEECSADTAAARARHTQKQRDRPNFRHRARENFQRDRRPHPPNPPKATSSETIEVQYARTLGLSGKVTFEEIRLRWRELASQYHPDKVNHLGPRLREVAESEMKVINEAYQYFEKKHFSKK